MGQGSVPPNMTCLTVDVLARGEGGVEETRGTDGVPTVEETLGHGRKDPLLPRRDLDSEPSTTCSRSPSPSGRVVSFSALSTTGSSLSSHTATNPGDVLTPVLPGLWV